MKAAVVIPPVRDFYFSPARFASLGAKTVVDILVRRGYEVILHDFTQKPAATIKLPESVSYLEDHIIPGESGCCSFFTTYRRFGPGTDECAAVVAAGSYDIVFVALFAFCYADTALEFARSLRKIQPSVKTAVGGAGAAVFPEYFSHHFDFILCGEGEIALNDFNPRIFSESLQVQNQNSLACCHEYRPGPYRHTAEGEFLPSIGIASSDKKSVRISVMLSRGCPKSCKFCSNHITHGKKFRKTDPDVLRELVLTCKEAFVEHRGKKIFINIEDDNFLFDKTVLYRHLEVLTEFFLHLAGNKDSLFFSAENGMDYTLLDNGTIDTLADDFRFRQFNFTLGSADQTVSSSQDRYSDTGKLKKILAYLEGKNIPAVTYFIAGLENDSPEKTVESLLFLDRNPGLAGISMFYAVPGLQGFPAESFSANTCPAIFRGSSAYPWNNTLSTRQLITAFRLSRTINFLKKTGLMTAAESELRKAVTERRKLFTITGKNSITEVQRADREMAEMFFSGR